MHSYIYHFIQNCPFLISVSDISTKTISIGENDKVSSGEIAQEEGNILVVCNYCVDNYKNLFHFR